MQTGFDLLLKDKKFHDKLRHKKVAYLGHHASVSKDLTNSLDLLKRHTSLNLSCALSPQHGWHAVEQANMIPSHDGFLDHLPLFSLYTHKTRELTKEQLDHFDILIVDLQDVGCRVYTYLSTLLLALKSCAQNNKSVLILDRPNPIGRDVEGVMVHPHFHSLVGIGSLPMRYGMTLGEAAQSFVSLENLQLSFEVIKMKDYQIHTKPWPDDRSWILPSPNMVDIETARCYPGTVLLEGLNLSEGRGTTTPLKIFGFPKMKTFEILKKMSQIQEDWMKGCLLRPGFFKPTFDKHKGEVCSALRIYADHNHFNPLQFRPLRLICLFLKALRLIHPDKDLFSPPPYEYEYEKLPIDILFGDSFLRKWIQDPASTWQDLEEKLIKDEKKWREKSREFYFY